MVDRLYCTKATKRGIVGESHDTSDDSVNTDMQKASSDTSHVWVNGHKVVQHAIKGIFYVFSINIQLTVR